MSEDEGRSEQAPGPSKEASATVYLVEELGDARLRCDQLVRYIAEGVRLVETSPHKDTLHEMAGHLLNAVPLTLFKLQKSLQAVALAANRIDYEEIKMDLRPEKVHQLEQVLEDVRIRQINRHSEPLMTPQQVAAKLRQIAATTREFQLPQDEVIGLIATLERGQKQADEDASQADVLDKFADLLDKPAESGKEPSRFRLATVLRRMIGDTHVKGHLASLAVSGGKTKQAIPPSISSCEKEGCDCEKEGCGKQATEEKQTKFEEGKSADPTENMTEEEAKEWRANTEKHKDKFKKAGDDPWKVTAGKADTALLALYKWATGGERSGNPHTKPAVKAALKALGNGGDLPEKRPSGKVPGALYDLAKWATQGDRSGNPHTKAEVKAANKALGGDGFDLPEGKSASDWKVTAALKPKDKKVIDAFYNKKPMEGSALISDGTKLQSSGMSGTFLKWQGGKVVVVSPGGNRTHDALMRYMKKTWPKNSLPDHAQLRSAKFEKGEDASDDDWEAPGTRIAVITKQDWQKALKTDQKALRQYEADLKTLQGGGKVPHLSIEGAKASIEALKAVVQNKQKLISKLAKFEKGEDADKDNDGDPDNIKDPKAQEEWKANTEKFKDKFKKDKDKKEANMWEGAGIDYGRAEALHEAGRRNHEAIFGDDWKVGAAKVLPYKRGRSIEDMMAALAQGQGVEVSETNMAALSKAVAKKGTNVRTHAGSKGRYQVFALNPKKLSDGKQAIDWKVASVPRSPNQAWEEYVGDQTPHEFMQNSKAKDPEKAVRVYAKDSDFFEDLSSGDHTKVVDLLVRHIERNKSASVMEGFEPDPAWVEGANEAAERNRAALEDFDWKA